MSSVPGPAVPAPIGAPGGRPSRLRRTALLAGVAGTVLLLDIATKVAVVASIDPGERVELVQGLLWLTVTRNAGAAFSLGQGATVALTLVAVTVSVVIVRTSSRLTSRRWAVALGLLLGGALGNLVDRMLRWPGAFRGHVVDWVQVPHWPVFNVADSCIVIGGILVVCLTVLGVPMDRSEPGDQEQLPDPGSTDAGAGAARA